MKQGNGRFCSLLRKHCSSSKVEKPKVDNEETKGGGDEEGQEGEQATAAGEEAKEEAGNEESIEENGEGGDGEETAKEEEREKEEVIEIKWLKWVSTSHPCKQVIEGCELKYEEQ
eukprot:746622-Hanusia_phi.AAC.1